MKTFDIGKELEAALIELKVAKRKRDRIQKQSGPREVNSDTSYVDADSIHGDHHKEAMTEIQELAVCNIQIRSLEEYIEKLQGDLERVKDVATSMEGTDEKVVILRDVCNMGLKDIAKTLNLTYGYVRQVSAKNSKNEQNSELTS